ncbi:MAG: hypothetical protein H6828_11650 [Planctomycetes bacterium]|nr:hypothetical protein [Planctomycetota bacterium]
MRSLLASALLLVAAAGAAQAGTYSVVVTGQVLSNSYGSGPFAGAAAGATAVLSFDVTEPGTPIAPGQLVAYAIDLGTFDLDINGSTGAALGGPTDLQIQNDFPAADGFRIFQTQLASGHFFSCEWGAVGSFFPSADITLLPGTYDVAANMTSFNYVIQGQGGLLEIFPMTLDVVAPAPGTPFCFCDGSGTAAPCGNSGAAGNGCANGANAAGANLATSGVASASASTLALHASGAAPGQPGLFFQGVNAVNGGLGNTFGDGLRCAGGSVVRLQVVSADALGAATSTIDVAVKGGVTAGDTRAYQYWYRDPVGSPCGSFFNLTNGVQVGWAN